MHFHPTNHLDAYLPTHTHTHTHTHTRYLHENIVNYAERLTAKFDGSLNRAMFACTGSEANEIALRMATVCTGHRGILCTKFAYHGNTTEWSIH